MTSCESPQKFNFDPTVPPIIGPPTDIRTISLQTVFSNCQSSIIKSSLVNTIFYVSSKSPGGSNSFDIEIHIDEYRNNAPLYVLFGYIAYKCASYPVIRNGTDNLRFEAHLFEFDIKGIRYQFQRGTSGCSGNFFDFTLNVILLPPNIGQVGNLSSSSILKNDNNPLIFINSHLLIDFSDIGHTIFKVIKEGKEEIYEKSCPKIVNVLQGEGLTAWTKLNFIYDNFEIKIIGTEFLENIIEYSMVRYFLTKLLYDKFMMKYLLQKNYKKFLNDLQESQYDNFYSYFTKGKFQDYYTYFN